MLHLSFKKSNLKPFTIFPCYFADKASIILIKVYNFFYYYFSIIFKNNYLTLCQCPTHCDADDWIARHRCSSLLSSGAIVIYQQGHNLGDRRKSDICHAVHFFYIHNGFGCLEKGRELTPIGEILNFYFFHGEYFNAENLNRVASFGLLHVTLAPC